MFVEKYNGSNVEEWGLISDWTVPEYRIEGFLRDARDGVSTYAQVSTRQRRSLR